MRGQALDEETAHYINMSYTCQALNSLPYSGGLLEQPYIYVLALQWTLQFENERIEKERKKASKKRKK